jgi:hypothetical protein
MKKASFKSVLLTFIIALSIGACKKETVNQKLSYLGIWTANYTLHSTSFVDNYKVYNWTSKLTINMDGTAQAIHPPGNPIITNQQVAENLKWGVIGDHTMYLRSLNWSVTSQTMNYNVREYGNNYIKMDGFDDLSQYWELVLNK